MTVIEYENEYGSYFGSSGDIDDDLFLEAILNQTDPEILSTIMEESRGDNFAYLFDMSIKPEHQGRGYGKSLLRKFVSECKAEKCRAIFLLADELQCQRDGFNLRDFYLKNGFKEVNGIMMLRM